MSIRAIRTVPGAPTTGDSRRRFTSWTATGSTGPAIPTLLELPVSIVQRNRLLARWSDRSPRLARRVANRFFPPVIWLRPNGRNLRGMLGLLAQAKAEGWPYVEFALHSSELMPGGSPWFRKRKHIERIYRHLEILFANAAESFAGADAERIPRCLRAITGRSVTAEVRRVEIPKAIGAAAGSDTRWPVHFRTQTPSSRRRYHRRPRHLWKTT